MAAAANLKHGPRSMAASTAASTAPRGHVLRHVDEHPDGLSPRPMDYVPSPRRPYARVGPGQGCRRRLQWRWRRGIPKLYIAAAHIVATAAAAPAQRAATSPTSRRPSRRSRSSSATRNTVRLASSLAIASGLAARSSRLAARAAWFAADGAHTASLASAGADAPTAVCADPWCALQAFARSAVVNVYTCHFQI